MSFTVVTLTGGAFQDLLGRPISYGYLTAALVVNGASSGFNYLSLGADGNMASGTSVAVNAAGTYYSVMLHTISGAPAWAAPHIMTVPSNLSSQNISSLITLTP